MTFLEALDAFIIKQNKLKQLDFLRKRCDLNKKNIKERRKQKMNNTLYNSTLKLPKGTITRKTWSDTK